MIVFKGGLSKTKLTGLQCLHIYHWTSEYDHALGSCQQPDKEKENPHIWNIQLDRKKSLLKIATHSYTSMCIIHGQDAISS